jgi:hypothetical protein
MSDVVSARAAALLTPEYRRLARHLRRVWVLARLRRMLRYVVLPVVVAVVLAGVVVGATLLHEQLVEGLSSLRRS